MIFASRTVVHSNVVVSRLWIGLILIMKLQNKKNISPSLLMAAYLMFRYTKIKKALPAHSSISLSGPGHSAPPGSGAGAVHCLVLFFNSLPLEQVLQEPHSLQPPDSEENKTFLPSFFVLSLEIHTNGKILLVGSTQSTEFKS